MKEENVVFAGSGSVDISFLVCIQNVYVEELKYNLLSISPLGNHR